MNAPVPPAYVTSLQEIFWGGILVAITMAMHGVGMLTVVRINNSLKHRFERTASFSTDLGIVILTTWLILLVHLLEVFAWAFFFLWKDAVNTGSSATANSSLCYYFALLDYTCLGSNYNLHLRWRLLEGMISMAGLMTFAWSTGVLMTLAQDFQDRQMLRLKERREHNHTKPRSTASPKHGG
jgi:hypothetical protein